MGGVYIILEHPWMKSIGTININAQNYFMNLSYKKKKIRLHDIYVTKKEGPKVAHEVEIIVRLNLAAIMTLDVDS